MIRINLLPKRSIMFHVKHWFEQVGILVADEPYVTPTHKYWYYHCWYPPSGLSAKGEWKVPGRKAEYKYKKCLRQAWREYYVDKTLKKISGTTTPRKTIEQRARELDSV